MLPRLCHVERSETSRHLVVLRMTPRLCHVERSETSRRPREILRGAQHDTSWQHRLMFFKRYGVQARNESLRCAN
jgi:TPP-dependent indolepyruvate ferredoxin oxidoreductase alpha subunit